MKIAVIGGVAAGTSAAAKARRQNPKAEITLFEKDQNISYAGCGLPYYISEVIEDRTAVVINTASTFEEKYNINVQIRTEVTEINTQDKKILFRRLDSNSTGEYYYDKLIISTGATPIEPSIPGIELNNIFSLRTVADADQIKKRVHSNQINKATIIGAGLIGLEMAESFIEAGLNVTVVEKQSHILPAFSSEMAEIIEKHLKNQKIELVLNDGVKRFTGDNKVKTIITEKEKKIETDLALLSIGIKPRVNLAKESGIKIGPTGAIAVNEKLETSISDIYAAGDCAESTNLITKQPAWVPLGSTANKQGRTAGENAAGGNTKHKGILKTSIAKIFDLTTARTGLTSKEAEENGFNPIEINIKAANHAHYYPEAGKLHIKGIFDRKTSRIIGAKIIGQKGVDKRIDVLSTAIYSKLTANDLFQIDLAYAPPYSSPKDPVAVLGMVAKKKL
ncbi:FAD-dependent oxidoreductase [Sporohalobacter salinus]|uniref:FAD-dependent oxidoreductase n=1 Tax=Sporohalobacter salinus TaxID=1494606 RepID=UPI00195FBA32|nr:FAD-dependent oxidoreductase [Sporohalobacter salinus]MBM7623802.1 NADPH-dependent 2,4-dienoyl-CoA reductase/sulfur reductase-like enzyme [Sporohalobacter salinus]